MKGMVGMKEKIIKEIVDNTVRLINYKTIANNYQEINKACDYIKSQFNDYYIKEYVINGYKNLVIANTQEYNLDVIFCGHLDVVLNEVYAANICDNKIFGRGAFDMKGQLAVLISLLKNNKSKKKIALLITSDEEIGGYCCKEIMKDYHAKVAFIPDAGKNFDLVIEEKGLLQVEIKVKGVAAHASEPFKGENAILKLFNIYEHLLTMYPMPDNQDDFKTSINLSKINGGSSNNMVPQEASMVLDIRFVNKDSNLLKAAEFLPMQIIFFLKIIPNTTP